MEQLAAILKERTARLRERFGLARVTGQEISENTKAGASPLVLVIFGIGLVLGVLTKNFTRQYVAIGYWDYLLPDPRSVVMMNDLQKDFLESGGSLAFSPGAAEAAPSCSRPTH